MSFSSIVPFSLVEQAKTAVEEVLRASYRPSTSLPSQTSSTTSSREPDNLFRGPYLSLDLPYTSADTRHRSPSPRSLSATPLTPTN